MNRTVYQKNYKSTIKEPDAKRWTVNDKVLVLSTYRRNLRIYRYFPTCYKT